MKNKKILLSILAIIVVFLIGGTAYYITTRTTTTTPVAPTAPESEPMAAEPCAAGLSCSTNKNIDGTTKCLDTNGEKTWCCDSGKVIDTQKKKCVKVSATPTATPSASVTQAQKQWTGSTACTLAGVVIAAAGTPNVSVIKEVYKDSSTNTAGSYTYTTKITTVSKNETFVYALKITNSGTANATGVRVTDTLKGNGLDDLVLVDKDSKCTFETTTRVMTCTMDVAKTTTVTVGFRVKTSSDLVNGTVITNAVKAEVGAQTPATNEVKLTASTVLSCNHTCTSDAECSSGYVCDTTSDKCRNDACLSVTSCVCPTATSTQAPTATSTPTPTATSTQAPTATSTPTPTEITETTLTTTPETLPDTGIFDLPGAAVFGGGLLMAIIGLLLAL